MCVVGFQLTLADGTRVVAGEERVTLIVASVAFFFLTCDSVGDGGNHVSRLVAGSRNHGRDSIECFAGDDVRVMSSSILVF